MLLPLTMTGELAADAWSHGGHTIGLAFSQVTRLFPDLVTVLDWQSCDHTGPVYEGDTLYSRVRVERAVSRRNGRGTALSIRSLVFAVGKNRTERQVLDWRFTALSY